MSDNQIALPRLVDVNWRVVTKATGMPAVAVDLQARDQPSEVGIEPQTRHETFEMSQGAHVRFSAVKSTDHLHRRP